MLQVSGNILQQVEKFKYVGSHLGMKPAELLSKIAENCEVFLSPVLGLLPPEEN